ncbi:MAG: hypothetical protein KF878_08280 [Planctomycetes bacterium]|nr:hypothetical protein [Planctomycetota bacterium]
MRPPGPRPTSWPASTALAAAPGRTFERGARLLLAASEAAWALRASPEHAAAVLDRGEALVARERLPLPLRERLLLGALRLARGRERQADLEERLAALQAEVKQDLPTARLARQTPAEGVIDVPEEVLAAGRTMLERHPMDVTWWESLGARGRDHNRTGTFDALALAFELRAGSLVQQANTLRQRTSTHSGVEKIGQDAVRQWTLDLDADPTLPVRRDDDLRVAAGVLYARELDAAVGTDELLAALAAAERYVRGAPWSPAGWLAAGYLRLELGDHGAALVALERAAALPAPFQQRRPSDSYWPGLYAAYARGALGQADEALTALRKAVDAGLWFALRLDDPRLACVPRRDLDPVAAKARENDHRLLEPRRR